MATKSVQQVSVGAVLTRFLLNCNEVARWQRARRGAAFVPKLPSLAITVFRPIPKL